MVRKYSIQVSLFLVFVIVLVDYYHVVVSHSHYDYCNIPTCAPRIHTACLFKSVESTAHCIHPIIDSGLTSDEKERIVKLHNKLRKQVAAGLETRGYPGPQPKAKYMPDLEWNNELADIAQKWANQCTWSHDKCRNVKQFNVGQNLAYLGTTGDVYDLKVEDMVQSWFDEVKDFNPRNVAGFNNYPNRGVVGHYTQMIWAESKYIGCGSVKYKDKEYNIFYLVCNYGPAGNILGQRIYETN